MQAFKELSKQGQSIWLDFIQRSLITSGELRRKVVEEGLRGVTSNPAIFEKAVTSGSDYDDFLNRLNHQQFLKPVELYEALAIRDVQDAADVFSELYQSTQALDGYVSLEVSPHLALDCKGTIAEGRRLWARVNRPNVMIKVPATPECLPAIEELIALGINVNVTLLFSQELYARAAKAYLRGIERRVEQGLAVDRVASVASFFISRIDAMVDGLAPDLAGKIAIANAKLTYQFHKTLYASERWKALQQRGAQVQRLLWASTSTKNPTYRDVLYVEELIGANTVNTVPPATYEAFLDHGAIDARLERGLDEATAAMKALEAAGISFKNVTDTLLAEGIRLFTGPFDKMLNAIAAKHPARTVKVPDLFEQAKTSEWMGWLTVLDDQPCTLKPLPEGTQSVVLLGMGGSSLAPDVLYRMLQMQPHSPQFWVIDSTDPAQIAAVEARVELSKTTFIVSSKSGSTLEPNIFFDYFWNKVPNPGQFIAITDPGSALEKLAQEKGFWAVYPGVKSIGGRYSALSNFGMVPAAYMGAPVSAILASANRMRQACQNQNILENPGVRLGFDLGTLALQGRDKVTFLASESLVAFGDWIEQLIAESTGKEGKGLVPVVSETAGEPSVYGSDRVFFLSKLAGEVGPEKQAEALERAGHPVIRIEIDSLEEVGAEFYRWEVATAIAGQMIGINPFDQPDVEAAKVAARALMEHPEQLPEYQSGSLEDYQNWLAQIKAGDYVAIQAFVTMNSENQAFLQKLRHQIRDEKQVATTLGFGPRFLHSTGQLHKGGPNTCVALQVFEDSTPDLPVPSHGYTFAQVKRAQALGDARVLRERNRRILCIRLEELRKLS